MRLQYFLSLLLFGLFFSACGTENNIPESLEPQKKAIVLEGMLSAKPLSIFEEGTHIITDSKGKTRILQSSITDLSRFEGHLVEITGEAFVGSEKKAVEVFVVQDQIPPPEKRMTRFPEQELSFVATLPSSFERQEKEKGILYKNPQSNAEISASFLSNTPKQKWKKEMQEGTEIKVAKKDAVRILRENGNIDIFVPLADQKKILLFSFSEGKSAIPEKTTFYEMLLRLEWISSEEKSEEESSLEIEDTPNMVCGGLAKKLCPNGYRCEFLSWEKNAEGVCIDATLPPQLVQKELSKIHNKEEVKNISLPEKKLLPEKFTEYENKRMKYSFAIPSFWHWEHIGAREGSLSVLRIGEKEINEENTLVEIRIENGIQKERQIKKTGGNISLLIPRDNKTHYRISGSSEWKKFVEKIGDSIQPLPQE